MKLLATLKRGKTLPKAFELCYFPVWTSNVAVNFELILGHPVYMECCPHSRPMYNPQTINKNNDKQIKVEQLDDKEL